MKAPLVLQTAVATALRIADPMALKMTTTTHHHNSTMHTVFEFHDLNAIALAHELELKVVSNQFNPLIVSGLKREIFPKMTLV